MNQDPYPVISIIIPTLNEEKVIEKTIRQFEHMSLPHEVIVTDGKSKDRTVEISRKWATDVAAYTDLKRQTIAAGRNAGEKLAHGEYLVFLDADCTIKDPDVFFSKALSKFAADKDIVAMNANLKVVPELETIGDTIVFSVVNMWFRIVNNIFHKGAAAGEFQMMPKSAFEKVGGYNENLVVMEDGDMFGRLSKIGKVYFNASITVYHDGRRAHAIGWPHLLWLWMANIVWVNIRKRSYSKEWSEVR